MTIYSNPDKKSINERKKERLIHKVCGGNVKMINGKYKCDRCLHYIEKNNNLTGG